MDPIADMLIRIKNAGARGLPKTLVPYSEFKSAIAGLLEKEGFLKSFKVVGKKVKKHLEVELAYRETGQPRLENVIRRSKPSRRLYVGVREIKPVKHGFGLSVLSTPKGILTGREAKAAGVGGELLFQIW